MFAARLSAFVLVCSIVSSSCSQTPTSPSTASAVAPTAANAQAVAAIPPGVTITPPGAIGITRFVAFGDSITWGATSAFFSANMFFAAANGGYPERLAAKLTTFHTPQRFTVFNDGLPGEFAVNALPRFQSMLITRQPGAVLLLEGINDLSSDVSVSRVIGALRAMLDAAALRGVPVLIATMFQTYAVVDPDGHYRPNGAAAVPEFNAQIRILAAGRPNVFLVDLEPLMANRALVGKDGIHLEEAGFEVMTSKFMSVIEAAFPVRGSFQ